MSCVAFSGGHRQRRRHMRHGSIEIDCSMSNIDDSSVFDVDDANDIHSRHPQYSEGNDLMAARMCAAVFALLVVALVAAMALIGRTRRT